jgi:glutaminyl-tRNA synthetase
MSGESNTTARARRVASNFITEIIDADRREGRYPKIVTRFPPEPNGYLHIGHAKSICLNFGIALDYEGECNLRFDDTNPETESLEYVQAIKRDIRWLGFEWTRELYASDYFERLYEMAVQLIEAGKAYVDSLTEDEIAVYRGTVTEPGIASPHRERSVAENVDLFARMRDGEFANGAHVLRAKIDLASPNMKLRDPVLVRIVHAPHYRTGNAWCIYPLYDFAHPLSDAIEGISHSLCTLEFENNRAIYDWLIENLRGTCGLPSSPRPYQYEFSRLELNYTVTSKRKIAKLVDSGQISGWDDPRMSTLSGLRRRGVTPDAVREFAARSGVDKSHSRAEVALLEATVRDDLNQRAPRVLAVARPLRVELTNVPERAAEALDAPYWPHDVPKEGSRAIPFGRRLYIDRDDFAEHPPKGFHRLSPGAKVRLRHAYVIRCDEVVKDGTGAIVELRCSYDAATLGRHPADGPVRGTIHWVSESEAVPAELRLYEQLFRTPDPEAGEGDLVEHVNPNSLVVTKGFVEPSVLKDPADTRYQFERLGYFWQDPVDSRPDRLVFNRIVTLRESWTGRDDDRTKPKSETDSVARTREASPSGRDKSRPVAELTHKEREAAARLRSRGVPPSEAAVLARDPEVLKFFEEAAPGNDAATIARWVVNDLAPAIRSGAAKLRPEGLGPLASLLQKNEITTKIAKDVLAEATRSGVDPVHIVEQRGLRQMNDSNALIAIVDRLLAEHADKAEAYRAGKTALAGFFVGLVLKETGGRANPQVVQDLVARRLAGS